MIRKMLLVVGMGAFLAVGCGSDDKSSDKPSSGGTGTGTSTATGTGGTTPTSLSANYKSVCVACHGADGATTPPGATTGKGVLKGTTLTEAAYKTAVRNGQGSMIGYDASKYSDADVTADFKFLTKK